MSFANISQVIKEIYSSCHKLTFWFCIIELNQLIGFTPSVPSVVLYAAFIGYAVYQLLRQNMEFDWFLTAFLISLLGSGETKDMCVSYLKEHGLYQFVE